MPCGSATGFQPAGPPPLAYGYRVVERYSPLIAEGPQRLHLEGYSPLTGAFEFHLSCRLAERIPHEIVESFMAAEEARKRNAKQEEEPRGGKKRKGSSFVRL